MDARRPWPVRTLERRVGLRLGLPAARADELLSSVRSRSGLYALRLVAFALVTSRPGRLLPSVLRTRAIGAVVYPMLREHGDVLVLFGLTERLADRCAGVVRP